MLPGLAKCHPRTGHEVLAPATLPRKGNPAPTVQEARGASEPVWTSAENPLPTPVLNPPDRLSHGKVLYPHHEHVKGNATNIKYCFHFRKAVYVKATATRITDV
jgi:hypothetical protein